MNSFLQSAEDDVSKVLCNETEFGNLATWTDKDGFTHQFPCVFGAPYIPLEVGDTVQNDNPRAIAPTVYCKNCRTGDKLEIFGTVYEILEHHPTGTGASTLILSRDQAQRPRPVATPFNRALQ
jgi:hypothetical protein